MSLFVVWAAVLGLSLLPLALLLANLPFYRPPRSAARARSTRVSVLIPARDEERHILDAVHSALAQTGVDIEAIVLDDDSSDETAALVSGAADRDDRVRLVRGAPLPEGWNGKQHACWQLAEESGGDVLLFVDADVVLAPGAAAAMLEDLERRDLALLSGIPRQRVEGWMESAVVPLIHFVLLGYLPMLLARLSGHAAFAAGCGQAMMVRRDAYFDSGGHSALRASRHDGLKLPRRFRAAGLRTGLADLTPLATCRMYESAREVWRGFGKNADEAMATLRALPIWTVLLAGGQVAPWILAAVLLVTPTATGSPLPHASLASAGVAAALAAPVIIARRFGYPARTILLHPVGVTLLLAIQWAALARRLTGGSVDWKGRAAAEASS